MALDIYFIPIAEDFDLAEELAREWAGSRTFYLAKTMRFKAFGQSAGYLAIAKSVAPPEGGHNMAVDLEDDGSWDEVFEGDD